MSYYDYKASIVINQQDHPFYALIMAAMRQADDENIKRLKQAFPRTWEELERRYHAPGGLIDDEHIE